MTEDWEKNAGIAALLLCIVAWSTLALGWYLAENSLEIFPAFLLASFPFGIAAIVVGRKACAASTDLALFATIGKILGYFWAVAYLSAFFTLPAFIGLHPLVEVSRAKSDMRELGVRLESYFLDNEAYPPAARASGSVILPATAGVSVGYVPPLLTTPVAYFGFLPPDPFPQTKREKELSYRYATDGVSCWILASNGPDKTPDADVADYPSADSAGCTWERFMNHFGIGRAIEYDATNGSRSRGDIIRVGP